MGSLTGDQQSIIIGSLLGDGYMSCKTHAYLKIGHSIKQKEYVDWKYTYLCSITNQKPKSYQGNGNRIGYRFFTRHLPELTPFYKWFYGNSGKKSIPDNLSISPFALAIWYMDDGARNRKSLYLNTQQFSLNEQRLLLKVLREEFALSGNLNKDKSYLRIRLYQESSQRLKQIIFPYMPKFMRYKLPL